MNKTLPILSRLYGFDKFNTVCDTLQNGKGAVSVFGLSARVHMLASLYAATESSILLVSPNDNDCLKLEEQLRAYGVDAMHFPAKTQLLGASAMSVSGGTETGRVKNLVELLHAKKHFVLISAETLLQRLSPSEALFDAVIRLECGMVCDMGELISSLSASGYERTELCTSACTFAVRGGRVDVFPSNSEYPVRIEFFGDEIDSLRSFDPEEQRSVDTLDSFSIYPATEVPCSDEKRAELFEKLRKMHASHKICDELQTQNSAYRLNQLLPLIYDTTSSIADYMPHDTVIVLNEPIRVMESAENEYKLFADNVRNILENDDGGTYLWKLMCEPSHAISALNQQRLLMLSAFTTQFPHVSPKCIVQIDSPAMTSYMENDELFLHEMRSFTDNEYSVIIFAGRRAKGIEKLLVDSAIPVRYKETLESEKDVMYKGITVLPESLPYGFEYREIKFAVITENELYGLSMHRKQAYSGKSHRKSAEKLELSKLSPGDYVVHEVHGIGRFMGVQEEEIDGRKHDYIVIEYAGTDRLSIPCEQLHCIQKYIGTGDTPPKLSKFASKDWTNTLARVRQSVKKLAFDLVALYGERMDKAGFSYSEDTAMQKQLEMSFPYDETPDQLTAIADIKHDMQSDKVMDRLLCGDVGFGKTEVALRAAFKAVMDCKQVAFLVPTTVLAYQHYNTLRSRYAHFGVRVDYISRFKSKKEIDETLVKLKNGEIDVIIGTHRLLSKDVQFFDLGLLIIDEEQRFGVGHKELIKELRRNIDVLTMTATPIPRTMHMSLIGIRDISLLDTPPKQRYPVQTFVTEYSDSILRDAVMKEVSRGGQVYVMYNNVRDMPRFYAHICELLPDVRISYAHGQMDEALLEHTMLDFIDGKFDVLLSSTIIENGLDVPNANTMIVLDSDKLGLSQMYQLRGRVGRSKKIGFTYFTYAQNKVLSEVSAKRLASIAQFTQLGSGYKIAMRDLQIRGAGDILGAQQSGHMEAIGYEMYRKLISEAVDEARGYSKPKKTADTRVEVPLDAYIPKTYIANEEQRLQMYKRISHVKDKDDYLDVQDELIDRFGDMPKAVQNLMNVALLKAISGECYITYLSIRADSVFMRFEKNAPYDIARIMDFVTQHRAKLSNDGGMSMLLPEKNADKAKVCATLSKTLTELKECLEG